jgi:hypothetical protein
MGMVDGAEYIRKDYAAILGSPAGVFPRLSAQLEVDGAANAVVNDALGIDPCVDDQAGAGLEVV